MKNLTAFLKSSQVLKSSLTDTFSWLENIPNIWIWIRSEVRFGLQLIIIIIIIIMSLTKCRLASK